MNKTIVFVFGAIIFGSLYGEAFCSEFCLPEFETKGKATSLKECVEKCMETLQERGLSEEDAHGICGAGQYGLAPLEDKTVADAE